MTIQEISRLIKDIPGIRDKVDRSVLAVREELVGIQALNPFAKHNSASRGLMQTGQFSQLGVLVKPEPPIIQDGLSYQLADNTWKCRVEEDCIVKAIISSKDHHDIDNTETIILVVELDDGTLDIIDVPYHYAVIEFGFRYKRNVEVLSNITVGSKLLKGTILAETPGVQDGTYAYGINADMKLVTDPNVGQDGVVISEELAEKMAYRTYHKFEANFNQDKILLNTYGDEKEYIGLPKVGDTLRTDGLVFALRGVTDDDIPTSQYDARIVDPIYDECFYLHDSTRAININGNSIMNNKVVSVKVYRSPSKKDNNTHGKEDIENHIEDLKQIYRRLVNTYNKHHDKKRITPRAHNLIVEALAVLGTDIKSELRYRNEIFTTRIEVIVETTHKLSIGNKLSCLNGGKGIIVNILPKSELGADICMDPTSLPGRTNPGRIYNMYFNGSSRNAKEIILHDFHTNGLESAFGLLIDYLSHYDTEQYLAYKYFYDNRHNNPEYINMLREVLENIEQKELYIYYKISSKKEATKIIRSLEDTMWTLKKRTIVSGGKVTKKPVTISPLYIILLSKSHSNFLSCSSPYLNHYNIPVKPPSSMKNSKPWSNTPTKLNGETEIRVAATNINDKQYIAEMISRNTNMESHCRIYKELLTNHTPTKIDYINTRNEDGTLPDGNPLSIMKNMIRTMGIGIKSVPELDEKEIRDMEDTNGI